MGLLGIQRGFKQLRRLSVDRTVLGLLMRFRGSYDFKEVPGSFSGLKAYFSRTSGKWQVGFATFQWFLGSLRRSIEFETLRTVCGGIRWFSGKIQDI